jgi:hypothetical protein
MAGVAENDTSFDGRGEEVIDASTTPVSTPGTSDEEQQQQSEAFLSGR